MESKKELRKLISMRKKQVPLEERLLRSVPVMERLMAVPEFCKAENILFYWAMPDEVHTQEAVMKCVAEGKNVFLPVVDGDNLRIRRFSGKASLVPGESYSIPEPDCGSEEVRIQDIDLVVVPGVAFDATGGRMGRGKGFYDRLLAGASDSCQGGPYKVGVCFDFQMVDAVPREPHDMLMDAVVSETGICIVEKRTECVKNGTR
ncbi:MAG TPA: 5-formyltetrahydrofolate cyclo-ligase [Candidatus Coprenecus pullistercoris]|nr:5-formyltetrahydrofolate cyclo-ligase [Candidatus Coprenecus pullistercoris]